MREKGVAPVCPHCHWDPSRELPNSSHLPPGTVLRGRYLIGVALGQGGFGITYLAWDLQANRKLAVKECFPVAFSARGADGRSVSALNSTSARQALAFGLAKFASEGQALQRFRNRPGVVSMLDFFQENGTAYIVMAYVEGRTLEKYLADHGGAISFAEALPIFLAVMAALQEIHAAGLLHRDISPANIYIASDGQPKLLDFGSARWAVREKTQHLTVIFKEGFTPFEQYYSSGHQGRWTDVYALAATLYRALTGKLPPPALGRAAGDNLVPPSRLGIVIPPAAEAALLRGMAVRYENRYQTIEAFRSGLLAKALPAPPEVSVGQKPADEGTFSKPEVRSGHGLEHQIASTPPPVLAPARISKGFFVGSLAASVGVGFLCTFLAYSDPRDSSGMGLVALLAMGYWFVVFHILFYRMWKAIQDGHARTTPGAAVGLLFVPFFGLYWIFQATCGFARDYNAYLDRHAIRAEKLPEGLFIAFAVITLCLFPFFLLTGPAHIVLGLIMAVKVCDAVNALPEAGLVVQRLIVPRVLSLCCTGGELAGQYVALQDRAVVIGRDPKRANVVLASKKVSGAHARVWANERGDGIWLEDIESTNGTTYFNRSDGSSGWTRLHGLTRLGFGSRFRLAEDQAEFEVRAT
jgi:serine/threonine protein kinase